MILIKISLFLLLVSKLIARKIISIDERVICSIKTTCFDCLSLSQCSWCPVERKCYSRSLPEYKDYCPKDKVEHIDYGFSLEENAICACGNDTIIMKHIEKMLRLNCKYREEEEECSGRGKCVCGRCLCDPRPDPDYPTKVITGDFCEYDNFSCNGPKCDEGPYNIHDVDPNEENNDNVEMIMSGLLGMTNNN